MAVRGNHAGLASVARVSLLDRDDGQQPASTRLVTPHAAHVGDASRLEPLPDQRRTHKAARVVKLTGWTRGRRAENDRVVAMVEPFDLHDRLRAHRTRVIARPLAERAFVSILAGDCFALNHDFGGRRDW